MNIDYRFIGWCNEGNHDKVWAVIKLRDNGYLGKFATVWGRRGKKLQCKIIDDHSDWYIDKLIKTKRKKDYVECDETRLDTVYPEFELDLEGTAVWAMLKD